MGKMMFGTQEKLECLVDVALVGQGEEPLCLASKITSRFFIAGIYVKDDGYVLKVKARDAYYPLPQGAELAELRRSGMLPTTFPAYSISTIEYLLGYSLWLAIAVVVLWGLIERAVKKRRAKTDALVPTSLGPPRIETKFDRFIEGEVREVLQPGETVQHQAYALDREPSGLMAALAKAWFVALTDRRLLFIATKVGALRPILENHGVTEIARTRILAVRVDDGTMTLTLDDGSERSLWIGRQESLFSNQRAFLRDVPRVLVSQGVASQETASQPVAPGVVSGNPGAVQGAAHPGKPLHEPPISTEKSG